MKKCITLLLLLFCCSSVNGMGFGKWVPLEKRSLATARNCYRVILDANKWLGDADSRSRNTLVVSSDKHEYFITLISGMLPLAPSERAAQESYYTFLDVLIGREKASVFSIIANESKDICTAFVRLFGKLIREDHPLAIQFREVVSVTKISNTSPLSEIMKLKDSIRFTEADTKSELYQFIERLKKYDVFVTHNRDNYLLDYLEALVGYISFLREILPDEATRIDGAIAQLNTIRTRAHLLSNEKIIDVLSDNALVSSVIPFLHTETVLAFSMFSRKTHHLDGAIIRKLVETYLLGNLILTTYRDPCILCEKAWAYKSRSDSKLVTVFSLKEHEGSENRHDESSFLQKIALASDINPAWNTINRVSSQKDWVDLLRYVFSYRMCTLLTTDALKRVIVECVALIRDNPTFQKMPILFDFLINQASVVNRATDVLRHRSRSYFLGDEYRPTLDWDTELSTTFVDPRVREVGLMFIEDEK